MNTIAKGSVNGLPDSPKELRALIRSGEWTAPTGNLCPGYEQGNVVILPGSYASDFIEFCMLNPKPCPVLAYSDAGEPILPLLGNDIDIRTDIGRYKVFYNGDYKENVTDINDIWRDDLVTFVLGCSLTFETALREAGIYMRFVEEGTTCAGYVTSIDTNPVGSFKGKLVVSMRTFLEKDVDRVIDITRRYPLYHGEPIHIGSPEKIGIEDLNDSIDGLGLTNVQAGEIPIFWACGITPQVCLENAAPELAITHAPGYMLVTDRIPKPE